MILILDDNKDDLYLIGRGLKNISNVNMFNTYDEFIKTFNGTGVAVIDYNLNGGRTGLGVLKEIKGKYPECKCIMISGTNNEKITMEFMRNGANDFVFKDSNGFIKNLADAVKRLL